MVLGGGGAEAGRPPGPAVRGLFRGAREPPHALLLATLPVAVPGRLLLGRRPDLRDPPGPVHLSGVRPKVPRRPARGRPYRGDRAGRSPARPGEPPDPLPGVPPLQNPGVPSRPGTSWGWRGHPLRGAGDVRPRRLVPGVEVAPTVGVRERLVAVPSYSNFDRGRRNSGAGSRRRRTSFPLGGPDRGVHRRGPRSPPAAPHGTEGDVEGRRHRRRDRRGHARVRVVRGVVRGRQAVTGPAVPDRARHQRSRIGVGRPRGGRVGELARRLDRLFPDRLHRVR